jgi:hypothetical protein
MPEQLTAKELLRNLPQRAQGIFKKSLRPLRKTWLLCVKNAPIKRNPNETNPHG